MPIRVLPTAIAALLIDAYECYDELMAKGLANALAKSSDIEIWEDEYLAHLIAQIRIDTA